MDGWGTEGAIASMGWHIVNEVRKFMKPDVRATDLERIEKAVDKLTDKVEDLRVEVAKYNGGGKK